ncbi:MAG: hypothetical protein ACRCZS_20100 [Chroococcidiopsis sp.]
MPFTSDDAKKFYAQALEFAKAKAQRTQPVHLEVEQPVQFCETKHCDRTAA